MDLLRRHRLRRCCGYGDHRYSRQLRRRRRRYDRRRCWCLVRRVDDAGEDDDDGGGGDENGCDRSHHHRLHFLLLRGVRWEAMIAFRLSRWARVMRRMVLEAPAAPIEARVDDERDDDDDARDARRRRA